MSRSSLFARARSHPVASEHPRQRHALMAAALLGALLLVGGVAPPVVGDTAPARKMARMPHLGEPWCWIVPSGDGSTGPRLGGAWLELPDPPGSGRG